MFKTYQDQLAEIEGLYNTKQYNATILDSAKLAEKVVGIFFNHFHTFLKTREENLKYLDFEKEAGEKYQAFLAKPTIGVGIGFYNRLLALFPSKPGVNQDIRGHLNTINTIRNAHVHAHDSSSSAQEAGQILDALEKILKSTNLLKASVDVVGVPLKYYLVFKSIEAKFERSDTEDDFKKIVNDASKVIPHLIDVLLNKTYHALTIPQKEKLIDTYFSTDRKERSLSDYYHLCQEVGIFENLDRSEILKESLEEISGEQEVFNRRLTRHFVNAIQVIIELTENPHAHHFLEYANAVKKRYLRSRKLSENDRMILQEKASESGISKDLARRIEEAVVETIDKDLILYQTLTDEGLVTEPGQSPTNAITPRRVSWNTVAVVGVILAVVALAGWYFLRDKSMFEEYEVVYLTSDTQTAAKLADKERTLENIGANFYYILSTYFNNQQRFPESLRSEYRKLLKDNPNSGEANFYLGMIYSYYTFHRQETDSSFQLLNKARELGVKGVFYDLVSYESYSRLGLSAQMFSIAKNLEQYPHPRSKRMAADVYLNISRDTLKATNLYKESIKVYNKYMGPYLMLSQIYVARKQYDSAQYYLEMARNLRAEDYQVIQGLANVYVEQGNFDKAKQLYREAINAFGSDSPELYYSFGYLLLTEDSIAQGEAIVEKGLKKFPKHPQFLYLQNSLNRRKAALQRPRTENKDSIRWMTNLEDAQRVSRQSELPILLYLFNPRGYREDILERIVFRDSTVILASKKFIPVRLNLDLSPDLKRRFWGDGFSSPFLVLNHAGDRIGKVSTFINATSFSAALDKEAKRLAGYMKANAEELTLQEVSNFEDAQIIAAKRNIPILVVVGDKRSQASAKLMSESLMHPIFKAAAQKLVFLQLNSNSSEPLLKKLSVNAYPSLYFFSPGGKLLIERYGFIPALELAAFSEEVIQNFEAGTRMARRVNWFYDFEEAKSYAVLLKKNIFVTFSWPDCESCRVMDDVFKDTVASNALDRDYVSVVQDLGEKSGSAIWEKYGIFMAPAQLITNESGNEIARHPGMLNSAQLVHWLDVRNKTRIASLLGIKEYEAYVEKSILGTELVRRGAFQSGINVLSELVKTVDDDPDVLEGLAAAQCELLQSEEAIRTFERGFTAGLLPDADRIHALIRAFIQQGKLQSAIPWFENQIKSFESKPEHKSYFLYGLALTYEMLSDDKKAFTAAEQAMRINPSGKDASILAIRLALKNKRLAEARTYLAKASRSFPSAFEVHVYQGQLAGMSGDLKAQKAEYSKAISIHNYAGGIISYQWLFSTKNFDQYQGIPDLLIRQLSLGLSLGGTNPWLAARMWMILTVGGRHDEALAAINKAIQIEPTDKYFTLFKSLTLHKVGRYEEAAVLGTEAESSIPDEALETDALYALGINNLYLKKTDEAKKFLTRAAKYPEAKGVQLAFQQMAKDLLKSL